MSIFLHVDSRYLFIFLHTGIIRIIIFLHSVISYMFISAYIPAYKCHTSAHIPAYKRHISAHIPTYKPYISAHILTHNQSSYAHGNASNRRLSIVRRRQLLETSNLWIIFNSLYRHFQYDLFLSFSGTQHLALHFWLSIDVFFIVYRLRHCNYAVIIPHY